jgi:RNA 3'-terminal phosphate cyclase
MKIRIQPSLKHRGYYPIGKGNVSLEIHQVTTIDPIQLLVAGELIELGGIIYGNIQ